MEIINLTPHDVIIDGIKIPPSGNECRVKESEENIGILMIENKKVPLVKVTFGDIDGLPIPKADSIYIVSSLVAEAIKNGLSKEDARRFVVPTDFIRDKAGKIIGAKKFRVVN